MQKLLEDLKNSLPKPAIQRELRQSWWRQNGRVWLEDIFHVIKYRKLDYALHGNKPLKQFQEHQEELLKQYHEACLLLLDCLKSASKEVRSHIEDTLFLPIAEIEKRPFKN